ncbi:hypothetical protein R3P38DRAFT_2766483 [Favolaschia claudopus]|uniref:Uncharacterized protein n=1 Tax=Favolaschia claudopus TaxID=2862362 RepID=A0AAW0D2G9_9AGAR
MAVSAADRDAQITEKLNSLGNLWQRKDLVVAYLGDISEIEDRLWYRNWGDIREDEVQNHEFFELLSRCREEGKYQLVVDILAKPRRTEAQQASNPDSGSG